MTIWFKPVSKQHIDTLLAASLENMLEMSCFEIGDDRLVAAMPITDRHRQPHGVLHGGISCVLAETIGSVAASLCINPESFVAVGTDITATHLRPMKEGTVYAETYSVLRGRRRHVWAIRLYDQNQRQICLAQLGVAILDRVET